MATYDGVALLDRTTNRFAPPVEDALKEVLGGSGNISLSIAARGSKGDWNRATETGTDNTVVLRAAVADAIRLGLPLYIDAGLHYGDLGAYTDVALTIDPTSPGRIAQPRGREVLRITHTLKATRTVTDIKHVLMPSVDDRNPRQAYGQVTISRTNMGFDRPQRGENFFLSSEEAYTGDFIGEQANGKFIFPREWVKVLGVGLDVAHASDTSTLYQGAFITGQTSNATGYIVAIGAARNLDGTTPTLSVLLNVVTGAFQASEPLTVDGVVKGNVLARDPYIVTDAPLLNTHRKAADGTLANAKLQKSNGHGLKVDITGLKVESSGDSDVYLADKTQRQPAIVLAGVNNWQASLDLLTSWKAGIQLEACFDFYLEVTSDKLPDLGEDSQAGWGYLVVLMGACGRFHVHAKRARGGRHGITTNVRATSGPPGPTDWGYMLASGVPARGRLTGHFIGFQDAAIDLHGGAMEMDIEDFLIVASGGYGRTQDRAGGIQDRGYGTRIRRGTIRGAMYGIRSVGAFVWPLPLERAYVTEIKDVSLIDVRDTGIASITTNATGGKGRVKVKRVSVEFDKTVSAGNDQWGADLTVGDWSFSDFDVEGASGGYIRHEALDRLVIRKGHHEVNGAAYNVLGQGSVIIPAGKLTIKDLDIDGTGVIPIYQTTATGQEVLTRGSGAIDRSNTLPFAAGIGTGTVLITSLKETGSVLALRTTAITVPTLTAAGTAGAVYKVTFTSSAAAVLAYAGTYEQVLAQYRAALPDPVIMTARISASGTLEIRFINTSTASVTVASAAADVRVLK